MIWIRSRILLATHYSRYYFHMHSILRRPSIGTIFTSIQSSIFTGHHLSERASLLSERSLISMASSSSLVFKVRRCEPELITPAKPTPHELKPLSDIDDQEGLRFQIPVILLYHNDGSMKGKDPVEVIRNAIANVLVFYYPFAGRLREGHGRKLIVDCTGEGVMFIEADADVRLDQFGDALKPPFPCWEELLYDVPGSAGVLDCPLLLIQVTRLLCGGFIFALRLNHTISDATGLVQFMTAVAEMARGATIPTVKPTWQRELLTSRETPTVTCEHREYDVVPETENTLIPLEDMAHRSFFFGPREMTALRKHMPPHLRSSTTFEMLIAFLWRCRTIAIQPGPQEIVRVICVVNARRKFSPPLPEGYYGNVLAYAMALTTAEKLSQNPVGYAVELVKKAKNSVTDEYMRSMVDMLVLRERPFFTLVNTWLVSDVTRAGFGAVDFGWGKPVYGGILHGVGVDIPGVASFYIPFRNSAGEDGILVPMCLPGPAMEKFIVEFESLITEPVEDLHTTTAVFIRSSSL